MRNAKPRSKKQIEALQRGSYIRYTRGCIAQIDHLQYKYGDDNELSAAKGALIVFHNTTFGKAKCKDCGHEKVHPLRACVICGGM